MKTVLFFTQKSCGPCRQIEPSIIQLCQQSGAKLEYIRVDTEGGKQTAQSAGEISTPVCIILDDTGNEITRLRNAKVILDGLPSILVQKNTPSVNRPHKTIVGAIVGGVIGSFFKNPIVGAIVGGVIGEITGINSQKAAIGAIKNKSSWKPPYKNLGVPELGWKTETNFKFAQNKTGVYLIKRNGILIYVGAGKNVYKTMLRHFERHKGTCYDSDRCNKQRYFDDYEKNEYLVRVVLTNTAKQAFSLEAALIKRYKPKDNILLPELFDTSKEMLKEFSEQKEETFDKISF